MLPTDKPVDFTWRLTNNAATYRLEVEDLQANQIISAILVSGIGAYRAPSWFKDKVGSTVVRWRVTAFDNQNKQVSQTDWRALRFDQERR